MLRLNKLVFLNLMLILLINCKIDASNDYSYKSPKQYEDGISVGTLQEVSIRPNLIQKAVEKIQAGKFGEVHSMLIYKDNKLVLEEYFSGHDYQWGTANHYGEYVQWNKDKLHYAHSVSKSVTSLCVGIALEKGYINSLDQSIFDYLPEYQYLKSEYNKYINIRQMLAMTSGIQWQEWNAPLSNMANDQVAIWFHKKGPIDFYLSRPMMAAPDTWFRYCGGDIEVLVEIVKNASGMSFQDFSKKYLFEPTGIDSAYWHIVYNTGEVHGAAGLRILPREMIKIGAMMLNNGKWDGKQIISENWVEKSATNYLPEEYIKIPNETLGKCGYAYTWWTNTQNLNGKILKMYFANGWGGQKIIVVPAMNMTVVFTGANYTSKVKEFTIFEKYILPSIEF